MPLPETLDASKDPCALSERWVISPGIGEGLILLGEAFKFDPRLRTILRVSGTTLKIISGFRTIQEQLRLAQEGRPAAPPSLSTHTSCPATGVDLRIEGHMNPFGNAQDLEIWSIVGRMAEQFGMRWGGGSPIRSGIPSDFNHFDLGPRR